MGPVQNTIDDSYTIRSIAICSYLVSVFQRCREASRKSQSESSGCSSSPPPTTTSQFIMFPELSKEIQIFISAYSDLFTSPSCSDSELCAEIAREVGRHYRPGVTFFTGGKISRFEVSVVTSCPGRLQCPHTSP